MRWYCIDNIFGLSLLEENVCDLVIEWMKVMMVLIYVMKKGERGEVVDELWGEWMMVGCDV